MSKLREYDELAIHHFELKKKYEKEKDKENAKYHKENVDYYDKLAFQEIQNNNLNIHELYNEQIQPYEENYKTKSGNLGRRINKTRAMRAVRYYHHKFWKTETIEEKERWGIDLIKMSLQRSANPVVSCSFGIDSIVTLYMTRKALIELGKDPSDIQVIWNNTLNEFPEVRLYAKQLEKDWNLKLLISTPKKPLKKVINDHGGVDSSYFFTRKGDRRNGQPLSEKCCGVLKHEPMKRAIRENDWDLQINGLRSDESTQRLRAGLRDGEFFYSSGEWKSYVCRPIMWMTEEDIWDYVEKENIPYNDIYKKNLIQEYPKDLESIIHNNKSKLVDYGFDVKELHNENLNTVTRKQGMLLEKLGFKILLPRTGCMACPIKVKYGYLHWIRMYYPKVFNTMIYNLEYGKALLSMIPDEAKEEIEFVLGIDLNEENAHEYLKDILESKPCVFDKF